MKNPIVSRKKYDADIKAEKTIVRSLRSQISEMEENLKLAEKATKEILPRLVNLHAPIRDDEFRTYRVCATFNRDMVERCFTHGGDNRLIRYFAKLLSHQIEAKMIQFNFARCDR